MCKCQPFLRCWEEALSARICSQPSREPPQAGWCRRPLAGSPGLTGRVREEGEAGQAPGEQGWWVGWVYSGPQSVAPRAGRGPASSLRIWGPPRTLYSSKWAQDKQRPVSLLQLIDCKLCRAHLPLNHSQTRRVWAVEGHRPRAWGESVVVPTRGPAWLPAPHPLGPVPGRALGDMKGRPLCVEPVGGPCPRHKASCERLHRGLSDCHVSM